MLEKRGHGQGQFSVRKVHVDLPDFVDPDARGRRALAVESSRREGRGRVDAPRTGHRCLNADYRSFEERAARQMYVGDCLPWLGAYGSVREDAG